MMNGRRHRHQDPFRAEWRAALACFVLAALTGSAFRLAAAGWAPFQGLHLGHLRNAHSHLMLFSWATPLLMALMARRLATGGDLVWFRRVIRAAIVLGLLTFGPFLVSGYGATEIAGVSLPLSTAFSTLSMLVWYAFAALYVRARKQRKLRARQGAGCGPATLEMWDLAVCYLVVGSLGAWARGALMGMGVEDPFWTQGSVQFFLVTFSFGWLVLGVIGELHARVDAAQTKGLAVAFWSLALGIPTLFSTAVTAPMPTWLEQVGYVGLFASGAGLIIHAASLWRSKALSRGPASFVSLVLVAGAMIAASAPPVSNWVDASGLRIVFLHLLLLGLVTLTLFEARCVPEGERGYRSMIAAVVVLLLAMLPTTGLWPRALAGPVALYAVAIGSFAPAAVGLWMLARAARGKEHTTPRGV